MEKLQSWMEEHLLPVANKIASNKYLKAISSGMISMMPCALAGSIALILISPPLSSTETTGIVSTIMVGWEAIANALISPLLSIYYVANTMAAIICCIGIAWTLARNYNMEEKEGIIPTSLALMMFLITTAYDGTTLSLSFDNLGGTGYFTAIIMAILGVEAYRFVMSKNIGVINITGQSIPPAITASFRGMIPGSLILAVVAFLNWALVSLTNTTLPNIMSWIMSPLVTAIDNPVTLVLLSLLVGVFWWFGIHDTCITSPLGILWTPMGLANAAAHVAGTTMEYTVTSGFWWTYLTIGGSGATMALCLLMCFAAKSKHLKTVGKLGIIPAIFNINEPVIFGAPLMLNPTMFIPFVLAMPINGLIAYIFTANGLVEKFITTPSWNLPTPLMALLGTLDVKAMILNIALIVVDMVLYYPFFKMYDKQQLADENSK